MNFKKYFLFVIISFASFVTFSQQFNEGIYKFEKVLGLINSFYVDTINQDKLIENAIVEMLAKLDPHSVYISKDEVQSMNEPLQGNFEGVGIEFNILQDTVLVVSPISGGPSEKVGIRAGDRIIQVDGKNIAGIGIKNTDVRKLLLGKKGTKVTVSILRRGINELNDYTITRDKIPLFSLDASYMIDSKTGYIKLNRFSATTMKEFKEALSKLEDQGLQNLILDLQGNGGGYLNTAVELADQFLEDNKLIVYTEGRNEPRNENRASINGLFENGKLIVLIDEGSASASEIVTGAIQDWDRGVVIGRRSYGKGLVQRQYPLPDGSEVRLTIARYFTPSGRCIQKPYDKGIKEYQKDIINRLNNGELSSQDSIHLPDSLKYKTLSKERTVYGGGGIMPDIFVPIDTTDITDYYRDLVRKGTINRFILNYIDKNRNELLSKYSTFEKFNSNFKISDNMLKDLQKAGEDDKIKCNKDEFQTSENLLKLQLKALISRDIFENGTYFQVMNQVNPAFIKAIEVIGKKSSYSQYLEK